MSVASQVGGDSEQVRAAMRFGLPPPVGAQEAIVGFLKEIVGRLRIAVSLERYDQTARAVRS